jgi:tetratricopeptide (TPR) repeat protein
MYTKNNALFLPFLLLTAWLAAGCSAGFLGIAPIGDRKEYAQARQLYEQGAYQEAITQLQDYIYKTKNVKRREARAYRLLGLSYEKTGQLSKALETYLEALEFHDDNVPLLLEAARLYQQTNLTDRSITLYERALQEEPDNQTALAGQAANYSALGFYSKARQFYNRFFEINPTAEPQYRARYAHTFLAQRKYEEAFIHITMALAEENQNADFWLLSAQARRGLNQPQEALADLQAALALAPQRTDLLAHQALWLYEAGDYAAAGQTARRLLQINPDSQLALWVQSLIAKAQGKDKEAAKLQEKVRQLNQASFIGRVAAKALAD